MLERRSGTLHSFGQLLRHRPSDEATDHVTRNDASDAPVRLLQGCDAAETHRVNNHIRHCSSGEVLCDLPKQSHVLLTLKQRTQVL